MGILNNIKQRPDNQKKFFSLLLAFILTLFIVGLWFSFSRNSADNEAAGGASDKLSSMSPWQVITDQFSQIFSGFNSNLSSTGESSSTVPVEVVSENLATSTGTSTDQLTASGTPSTVSTTTNPVN